MKPHRIRLGWENSDLPVSDMIHRLLPKNAVIFVIYMPYWAFVATCLAVSILKYVALKFGDTTTFKLWSKIVCVDDTSTEPVPTP